MSDTGFRRWGMAVGAIAICSVALIVFLSTRGEPTPESEPFRPPRLETPVAEMPAVEPAPVTVSIAPEIATAEIESTSASPEFAPRSLAVPPLPVRVHPHHEMLGIMPEDAFAAMHTPSVEAAIAGLSAFLRSGLVWDLAGDVEREMERVVNELRERGLDAAGPLVFFLAGDPVEIEFGRAAWILEIADAALFQSHWDALSPQAMVMGHPTWLEAGQYRGAASAVGRCALEIDEQQSAEWLLELLRPQPRARVADAFDGVADGTIAVGLDLGLLARALRPLVDQAGARWQQRLTEGRLNVGGEELMFSQMLSTHAGMLLGLMESAAPAEIRFTPSSTAIAVTVRAALAGAASHPRGGSRSGRQLTLASRLPDGAAVAIDTARTGAEGRAILDRFHALLIEMLAGGDSEMRTALSEVGSGLVLDLDRGREFALAIYRSASGDVWPRRVVMVRFSSDSAVHEAIRRLRDPSDLDLWRSVPRERLSARAEEPVEVEGQRVAHIVFGGAALEGVRDLTDPAMLLASPALALLGPPGEVHHWVGQMGDTLIFTTEPRPELMAEILRGEAEGLAIPKEVEPVLEGVDLAFHARWSQIIGWNRDLEESIGDPSGRAQQHGGMATSLAEYERCLWIGVDTWRGGFEARMIWPAVDLERLSSDLFG